MHGGALYSKEPKDLGWPFVKVFSAYHRVKSFWNLLIQPHSESKKSMCWLMVMVMLLYPNPFSGPEHFWQSLWWECDTMAFHYWYCYSGQGIFTQDFGGVGRRGNEYEREELKLVGFTVFALLNTSYGQCQAHESTYSCTIWSSDLSKWPPWSPHPPHPKIARN